MMDKEQEKSIGESENNKKDKGKSGDAVAAKVAADKARLQNQAPGKGDDDADDNDPEDDLPLSKRSPSVPTVPARPSPRAAEKAAMARKADAQQAGSSKQHKKALGNLFEEQAFEQKTPPRKGQQEANKTKTPDKIRKTPERERRPTRSKN